MRPGEGSDELRRIDAAMQLWRQGDCALEVDWFAHFASPGLALTADAEAWSDDHPGDIPRDVELIDSEVDGVVVLSQTCDLVRSALERPFVEVAPLVRMEPSKIEEVRRLRRPRYAYVPGVADRQLVADLDRIMTVEKAVVMTWRRTPGGASETERGAFAEALARKRSRPAFPDDFVQFVLPLKNLLTRRAGKKSAEGLVVDALLEIRVEADPGWDAARVELMFWFVRPEDSELGGLSADWSSWVESWLKLLPASVRYRAQGAAVPLSRMTALDYCRSDRLDLDHLSGRGE
jgi:hypothetical protein